MTSNENPLPRESRLLLLDDNEERAARIRDAMTGSGMTVVVCDMPEMALPQVYNDPPDIIAIHHDFGDQGLLVATAFKGDNVFAQIPVLFLLGHEDLDAALQMEKLPFDDYVLDDSSAVALGARARLCLQRAHSQLDANPLTRLPGNNSIIAALEERLDRREEFAAVYVDLDNFKAFNDRYGFSRGDEALRMTARLVVNSVTGLGGRDAFVGHVGGDDFFFIIPLDRVDSVCGNITENFDKIIVSLFDEEDRRNGCITSTNRRGEVETFPLMTISLVVAFNKNGQFRHPGQISTIAAELKKAKKNRPGSGYLIDRRTYPPPEDD